jgi:hypothetical protein
VGKKEDSIASLDRWAKGLGMGFKRTAVVPAPPPEVLEDLGNQIVAKDMTIQALRADLKERLAGELETAWSYVALFVVAAAKLAERLGQGPSPHHGPPLLQSVEVAGDKLEQIFAEYELKQEAALGKGTLISVTRRSDGRVVLKIPIQTPPPSVATPEETPCAPAGRVLPFP